MATGKSSSGPSSGVHLFSVGLHRRIFSAPRRTFVHSIASFVSPIIHSSISMCDFLVFISCPVHPQKSSTLSIRCCMLLSLYCIVVRMTFPVPPLNARFIQLTASSGSSFVSPCKYVPSSANMVRENVLLSPFPLLTTYGSFDPVAHTHSFQSIVHTHPSGDRSSPCA